MKKQFSPPQIVLSLFAAAALFCSVSCNKGKVSDEVTKQKTTSSNSNVSASGGCYFPVIREYYARGRYSYGSYCITGTGICHVIRIISGGFVPCPIFKLPNCQIVDCGDPWNYRNIGIPPPYNKYFPNSPLDSIFVPIKVTSNIAVLQFYAEIKGTLNSQTLTLPTSFSLTKEVSQSLGLTGYRVPAGTYPVIFDTQNKTLNAIVSVK